MPARLADIHHDGNEPLTPIGLVFIEPSILNEGKKVDLQAIFWFTKYFTRYFIEQRSFLGS